MIAVLILIHATAVRLPQGADAGCLWYTFVSQVFLCLFFLTVDTRESRAVLTFSGGENKMETERRQDMKNMFASFITITTIAKTLFFTLLVYDDDKTLFDTKIVNSLLLYYA